MLMLKETPAKSIQLTLPSSKATYLQSTDKDSKESQKKAKVRFELGSMLGKGGFATVYECKAQHTGKRYAIKVIPRDETTKPRFLERVSPNDRRITYIILVLSSSSSNDVSSLPRSRGKSASIARCIMSTFASSRIFSSIKPIFVLSWNYVRTKL